jgi:hypothetical protein
LQLPQGPQDEIFGNVASLVAFNLSAKDTMAVRKAQHLPENEWAKYSS